MKFKAQMVKDEVDIMRTRKCFWCQLFKAKVVSVLSKSPFATLFTNFFESKVDSNAMYCKTFVKQALDHDITD